VRREPIVANPRGEFFDYVPNQLLGHSVTPWLARAAHLSEELSCLNARRYHPVVHRAINPIGYRDGSNVAALAGQLDDCPMPFALLQVIDR